MLLPSLGQESPLAEDVEPTPVFVPEGSHGPRNTVGIGSQKVGQDGKQLSSSTGRREEQINSDSPESAELQGRVAWGVLETRWKGPLLLETA